MREQSKMDIPKEWEERRKAGLCPVCGRTPEEFEPRRKVFCSQECASKFARRYLTWQQYKDALIMKTKKCAICGVTEKEFFERKRKEVEEQKKKLYEKYKADIEREKWKRLYALEQQFLKDIEEVEKEANDLDSWFVRRVIEKKTGRRYPRVPDHAFEVDHIVPISEGGAMWDKDNLQVLCVDCHRKKTAEERKNRKNKKSKKVNK